MNKEVVRERPSSGNGSCLRILRKPWRMHDAIKKTALFLVWDTVLDHLHHFPHQVAAIPVCRDVDDVSCLLMKLHAPFTVSETCLPFILMFSPSSGLSLSGLLLSPLRISYRRVCSSCTITGRLHSSSTPCCRFLQTTPSSLSSWRNWSISSPMSRSIFRFKSPSWHPPCS